MKWAVYFIPLVTSIEFAHRLPMVSELALKYVLVFINV